MVVQRYGLDISGGAELHARYIAEHLGQHVDVRVLTTCARDYITWRNEFAPGLDVVNGVTVERFPVIREREALDFSRRSDLVFNQVHSLQDELDWLDSEGPRSPALIARIAASASEFDFLLMFSVRYYHAYHAARVATSRAVLVPTAEREPSLGLSLLPPIFRGARAVMYNSEEERALIEHLAPDASRPGMVVGVGSDVPTSVSAERARQTFSLHGPYLVYVGRIDANKGCPELFSHFLRYSSRAHRDISLVLIGTPIVQVPAHPRIHHLGFVSDQDKFDVIAGSEALVMPSYFESLSMVALEAWALGRPVIANGRCDVLVGQCLRSGAGLYYEDATEFEAVVEELLGSPALAEVLGRRGREYYQQHYSWPVIEHKYLEMLTRLSEEAPPRHRPPLPGWWARRRRNARPAAEVLHGLPAGPVRPQRNQVSL